MSFSTCTPDGKIIPFCTMNTLLRVSVEKFSQPLDEQRKMSLYNVEALNKTIMKGEA